MLRYRLCPRCARAVPVSSSERYCINDGTLMLERCPDCGEGIASPYARFCAACGLELRLNALESRPLRRWRKP